MIRAKAYDKAHIGDWVIVRSMGCNGYVEKELKRLGDKIQSLNPNKECK